MATTLACRRRRAHEVYDNSHIMGTNAVGAMIVAGPDGFMKNQYRKFNIRSEGLTPGDDYGMMREVLQRRSALLDPPEHPRATGQGRRGAAMARPRHHRRRPRPAHAVREIFAELGVTHVPLLGRQGSRPRRRPRDPVRCRARRSCSSRAIPCSTSSSACATRPTASRSAATATAQERHPRGRPDEIPGIGPTRKRALLLHFGTLKEIERASLADLGKVPGVSAESARKIFEYFHPQPG